MPYLSFLLLNACEFSFSFIGIYVSSIFSYLFFTNVRRYHWHLFRWQMSSSEKDLFVELCWAAKNTSKNVAYHNGIYLFTMLIVDF